MSELNKDIKIFTDINFRLEYFKFKFITDAKDFCVFFDGPYKKRL